MIDIEHLEKYKENNRIEAKKALGGFPRSVWETYSAFANTLGGIILLGVEESPDKSLKPVDLPNPQQLVKEFWDTINNPNKVSVNILSNRDVRVVETNGCHIVCITVPRAERFDKPVFLDGNPMSGTYRRNGEGDYRCTKDEVSAMLRDASSKTQDIRVLETMDTSVFDVDSVRRYRNRMSVLRPGHVWEELEDCDFLYKVGALGRSRDGKLHPTAAGLLMFGHEYEIVREFPYYFLDYREESEDNERWVDRVVSTSGDWSGNLYDFYFRVYQKLTQDIRVPFKMEKGERVDDTPVHGAIREALANCLVNADYYGSRGVVVVKSQERIVMENPGGFRIPIDDAKSGGVSDPRNTTLIKMFNLIQIGERAGSGIPKIYRTWDKEGWERPLISEAFEPERITISLTISPVTVDKTADNQKPLIKTVDKTADNLKPSIKTGDKTREQKAIIIEYLTDNVSASAVEISRLLGKKASRTRELLRQLKSEDILVSEGENRNKIYKLKS